ncbi:MAG: LCP family protein [Nocardioides sp.]|uniref:LCP family protein n=1 Tax=Nocardioides sp. TaxID=35761 RepID=UPI003F025B47
MADRRGGSQPPEEGSPEYEWLYGSRRRDTSDDSTQVMRGSASRRPSRSPRDETPYGPEPTRVMPAGRPPRSTDPRAADPRSTDRGGSGAPPQRPVAPTPAAARPPRRRGGLRWVKWALVAWLVFLLAVPLWSWSRVAKVDADPGGERPADQKGTTYLIVGSDSREGLTEAERKELGTGNAGGQRTDTIMLLHIGKGPNLLMSIPRDSIVDIPGRGSNKVNAAYAWGGPKLLVQTLEQETGIRIDDYVEIGMGGVVGLVDAVGGIEICPTEDMKDPQANLDIKKGCQQADGVTALGYARSRKTSQLGDIDRARHQREVVSAVGSKALSPWSVINPVRYVRLGNAASSFLTVSEGTGPVALARFALAMTSVDGEKGLTCGVPISDLAVNWDSTRAPQMFEYVINDDTGSIPKKLCTPSGLPR